MTTHSPTNPFDTEAAIKEVCDDVAVMLISKNRSYGDSAINPIRCFSKSDSVEQIKVRLDDKLSRLMRGDEKEAAKFGEDVEKDLMGYLVLLRIARARLLSNLTRCNTADPLVLDNQSQAAANPPPRVGLYR